MRVIADAVGSRAWSNGAIEMLRRVGAHVVLHNPVSIWRLHRLGLRAHRKLAIADDTIAFAGGFNFVDVFAGSAAETPWLDYVVGMKGTIVSAAAATFARSWRRLGAPDVDEPAAPRTAHPSGLSDILLIDSPVCSGRRTVRAMHEAVIESARRRISIHNPFFLPDQRMLQIIRDASKRGVDVRVIVPGLRMAHRLLLDANRHRYAALLASGVRIFEFGPSMMHAKTIVVDGALTLIGSANFDPRSLASNDELTVAISDPSVGSSMEAHFAADLANRAEIVHLPLGTHLDRLRQVTAASLIRFL